MSALIGDAHSRFVSLVVYGVRVGGLSTRPCSERETCKNCKTIQSSTQCSRADESCMVVLRTGQGLLACFRLRVADASWPAVGSEAHLSVGTGCVFRCFCEYLTRRLVTVLGCR